MPDNDNIDNSIGNQYNASFAQAIEKKWQHLWEQRQVFRCPNTDGDMSEPNNDRAKLPKKYILDMFPYPSGKGLHVGHPLGYIATDIYSRYNSMTGHNVLHAMGMDAFGLPAENYAVQAGRHPRETTDENIATMRRQLRMIGLGLDDRRGISTTDPGYYRWTQWLFKQIFESYFDDEKKKARPISDLIEAFENGTKLPFSKSNPNKKQWAQLSKKEKSDVLNDFRLAYVEDQLVNWCPALGTVLANEEVTNEGRSERGNYPVFKRPLKQWIMRTTKYADRLVDDLDLLDWPAHLKDMQRNWIGRSHGATVSFQVKDQPTTLQVFTTRPDTLFGVTYMVVAPEHPWVTELLTSGASTDLQKYVEKALQLGDLERKSHDTKKTGVDTHMTAINPVNGAEIPIFVADYVLGHYGTGAIMAVPAHDQRDFDFAVAFNLPIAEVVQPPLQWYEEQSIEPTSNANDWPTAFVGDGEIVNSSNTQFSIDGMSVDGAKEKTIQWLQDSGLGERTTTYSLHDWPFSRQRYWGEPFPIVFDEDDIPYSVPDELLPVELPELIDFAPRQYDEDDSTTPPEQPLGRAEQWREVLMDLGDGIKRYRRELNTMPQWAGSCWYYLRYLDPTNNEEFLSQSADKYWMRGDKKIAAGGVDLYVGGAEHAVLHLIYARYWHKILFDLNLVSTPEPFQRLINQGMIQGYAYQDPRGVYVNASEVTERDGRFYHNDVEVTQKLGKIGKSLKNMVTPDSICEQFGADSLRLYEMHTGPLSASRPWDSAAITGSFRFLQKLWRNLFDENGKPRVNENELDTEASSVLHSAIKELTNDMESLSFNVAVAHLMELNNYISAVVRDQNSVPRELAETIVLMLAPIAPHFSEEAWERLGHKVTSINFEPFPKYDESKIASGTIDIPVQINGKTRTVISVSADLSEEELQAAAMQNETVQKWLANQEIVKKIVIKGRMVAFVVRPSK